MDDQTQPDLVRRIQSWNIDDGKRAPNLANAGHRRASGVRGVCVLCEQEERLLLGHIIPRWSSRMFSPGAMHNITDGQKQHFLSQDGAKEYLLCADCEQRLGVAENYLAVVCRGTSRDLDSIHVRLERGGRLHGIDERLIMRSLLGICLKAHFSKVDTFRSIRLDGAFIPSMRRQILSDRYRSHLYYTNAIKWMDLLGSGVPPRDSESVGMARSSEAINIAINLGGMKFIMSFRSTPSARQRVPVPPDGYLATHRPWNIFIGDISLNTMFADRISQRQPDLPKSVNAFTLPPDMPCPCGLSPQTTYQECCLGRWYPHLADSAPYEPTHECPRGDDGPPCNFPEPNPRTAQRP